MTELEKTAVFELDKATSLSETSNPSQEKQEKGLNAQDLLTLAQKAEEQAKNAALAADEAGQAARSTLSEAPEQNEGLDDKFLEAKILLARQAAAAAEAALQAQTSARDATAAAICQAEADTSSALTKAKAAQLEVERLSLLLEQADESALYAHEAAQEAAKAAEEKAAKKEATIKALEAAKLMAEDAQKEHEASLNILKTSQEKAIEATERLNQIHSKATAAHLAAEEIINKITPEKPPLPPSKSIWKIFWSYLKLLLVAFVIALLLRSYVFEVTQVTGGSMLPYLNSGDNLIASKISYLQSPPQRGDIIILDAPDKSGEFYVKRVVGLPNEHIVIKDGAIFIDGKLLDEPYLIEGYTVGEINQIIEKDSFFILGDNRDESHDSRDPAVGTILEASIRGKVVFRVYPWNSFGFVKN